MTIARVWRGWAEGDNAPAFEAMITDRVLPGIRNSGLKGLLSLTLLKRKDGQETEYQTILVFEDLASIKAFAGDDAEKAHLDPAGLQLLSRHDERVRHYEIIYQTSD